MCIRDSWYPYREGKACSSTSFGSNSHVALRTTAKSTCTNIGSGDSLGTLYCGGTDASDVRRYSGLFTSCWTRSRPYRDIWSSNAFGTKHGVSETRKPMCEPQALSKPWRSWRYFSGVKLRLNSSRSAGTISGLDKEAALLHDLLAVNPDIEVRAHHVNVGAGIPLRASVRAVGVSESNVQAGKFLVLQDLPDDVLEFKVRSDGELADEMAILVGVGIGPELLFQNFVIAEDFGDAIVAHLNRQWLARQVGIFLAQVVANHAVHNISTVHFAGSCEHLAAGQVPPLIRTDDAAGFYPSVVGIQRGRQIAAGWVLGFDFLRFANDLNDFLAERIHAVEV